MKAENPNKEADIALTNFQTSKHAGPLPSPQMLLGYEKALPGLAERIVVMAKNEVKFRHAISNQAVKFDFILQVSAQFFAFCISGIALVGGIYVALHSDNPYVAAIVGPLIGSAGIAGIISAFVIQRKEN